MNKESRVSQVSFHEISIDEEGQRIDNFLMFKLKGVPRSRIYKAIRGGEVRVNKKRVKPPYKLCAGDLVRIPPLFQAETDQVFVGHDIKAQIEALILYEDDDLLIVNKPSGLAVHGGSGIKLGLIEVVRQLRPDCRRMTLVHRLDRETSGCIVLAKKMAIVRALHQQLREKTMQKKYLALVKGRWPRRKVQVDIGLEKNVLQSGERIVKPAVEGKRSLTRFRVVEPLIGATLVEASPVTGRTHQIRVHCQYAGFPLLGDEKYAGVDEGAFAKTIGLKRLFLHASSISFHLPSGKTMTFDAPLPEDLKRVLDGLHQA